MIDLYYWTTPNGHKITIFLEEAQLPYRIVPINISKGEQFQPDFLRIAPNNRIPAIVDHAPADGGAPVPIFESGAILLYLAEKTGRFIPSDLRGRIEMLQWLFWGATALEPLTVQVTQGDESGAWQSEEGEEKLAALGKTMKKPLAVFEAHLAADGHVAGGRFTVADVNVAEVVRYAQSAPELFTSAPHVKAWLAACQARPAFKKMWAARDSEPA